MKYIFGTLLIVFLLLAAWFHGFYSGAPGMEIEVTKEGIVAKIPIKI